MKKVLLIVAMVLTVALALPMAALFVSAADSQPTYDTAVVDGNTGEWDLGEDFFAHMYNAGKTDATWPGFKILSELYLRYDCVTGTLYVLVMAVDDLPVLVEPDNAFVKIENTSPPPPNIKLVDGNDGALPDPPDFDWVGLSDSTAQGWEACAELAEGSYSELNVHCNIEHDGESKTSAVANRAITLEIDCDGAETQENPVGGEVYAVDMASVDRGNTWALWLGSALILIVVGGIVALKIRRAH